MSIALPESAMVLAAGLGERLRPLTDDRPKPMIPVGGKRLIDWTLDGLASAGVARAVVNLHWQGAVLRAHLADRETPAILFSDEAERLETGGGVVKALRAGLLPADRPFFVTNADTVLLHGPRHPLHRLAENFDPDSMAALLLLMSAPRAVGYDGPGDFVLDRAGRVSRRVERFVAPTVYTGVMLAAPSLFAGAPDGAFSLNRLFDRAIAAGRLSGLMHDGLWFHVGTPAELAEADPMLDPRSARWLVP